jgi:glycosyltransferase involved in cell wall biosynthesis
MSVPSFSVIIETANLSLADLGGLRETLESLAAQSYPLTNAREVLIADSGDCPPELLKDMLKAFPWARAMGLPEGTGYEELKMAGAKASTGEVIVFADGDCFYVPGWLESLLTPFADPSVSIVGGATEIDSSGPYGLGVAIAFSFPSRGTGLYTSDRYHLNNVAFRRTVLEAVPIPARRPCYRMNAIHAARLLAAGYTILRQPAGLAIHAAPNGLSHFVWRFLLMGLDGVVVPRLIAEELPAAARSGATRRPLKLLRYWVSHAAAKVADEVSRKPSRILTLPFAAPVFASAVALQAAGAVAGLVAPDRLLDAVPDDILRSSTCQPSRASAASR